MTSTPRHPGVFPVDTGITPDVLGDFLRSVRDSFEPDAYRAQMRAEEVRVTRTPPDELQRARALLEKHGYTVVPTDRLVSVSASHTFSLRDLHYLKDWDGLHDSVMGSLAGQLGVKIVERGGTVAHDITHRQLGDRLIGHSAVVLLPSKPGK